MITINLSDEEIITIVDALQYHQEGCEVAMDKGGLDEDIEKEIEDIENLKLKLIAV